MARNNFLKDNSSLIIGLVVLYFGYTKVNESHSIEYKINHPSWQINGLNDYKIECDFAAFYGKDFEILNHVKPHSVMLAEGSDISVDWKRISF